MINLPADYNEDKFLVFRADPKAKIPFQATAESAGYDLYTIDPGVLYPGETKTFSLGIIVRPPQGYHVKIWGRSGWGLKYGVGIPHGMGLVDRDFCGPTDVMKVVLHRACMNGHNKDYLKPLEINIGDRIAQMTIEKTNYFELNEIENAPDSTSRGGWGSSGIK